MGAPIAILIVRPREDGIGRLARMAPEGTGGTLRLRDEHHQALRAGVIDAETYAQRLMGSVRDGDITAVLPPSRP